MSGFEPVFAQLRAIMLEAAAGEVVARDAPGDLVIHRHRLDAKTGKPAWFGAVTIKRGYVAFHLMPIYDEPALAEGLSDGLAKRRQGKSCFNFKRVDPDLFAELAALARRAAQHDAG